jgi:hypothetical protein
VLGHDVPSPVYIEYGTCRLAIGWSRIDDVIETNVMKAVRKDFRDMMLGSKLLSFEFVPWSSKSPQGDRRSLGYISSGLVGKEILSHRPSSDLKEVAISTGLPRPTLVERTTCYNILSLSK